MRRCRCHVTIYYEQANEPPFFTERAEARENEGSADDASISPQMLLPPRCRHAASPTLALVLLFDFVADVALCRDAVHASTPRHAVTPSSRVSTLRLQSRHERRASAQITPAPLHIVSVIFAFAGMILRCRHAFVIYTPPIAGRHILLRDDARGGAESHAIRPAIRADTLLGDRVR